MREERENYCCKMREGRERNRYLRRKRWKKEEEGKERKEKVR